MGTGLKVRVIQPLALSPSKLTTCVLGQQRALTLVRPHSKIILQEAIRADCEFLARSNIMDYSYVFFLYTLSESNDVLTPNIGYSSESTKSTKRLPVD